MLHTDFLWITSYYCNIHVLLLNIEINITTWWEILLGFVPLHWKIRGILFYSCLWVCRLSILWFVCPSVMNWICKMNIFLLLPKYFTLSQTSPGVYVSALQVFWKHYGKRRNSLYQAISPFPTVFSTCLVNSLPFSLNSKLLPAKSSSLERSKICRMGKS